MLVPTFFALVMGHVFGNSIRSRTMKIIFYIKAKLKRERTINLRH